jgi:Flp pilus assembly pilin Flp
VDALLERFQRQFAGDCSEAGQTLPEYAVTLTVITLAIVVTVGLLSVAISGDLTRVIGVL